MASGQYTAWYTDARGSGQPVDMPMQLVFIGNHFSGVGLDEVGYFAVVMGTLDSSTKLITFEKKYATHNVLYEGTVPALKTPLEGSGSWCLAAPFASIRGSWGMKLHGSPSHMATKQTMARYHAAQSSQATIPTEQRIHPVLPWCPIGFVATALGSGASLFYLCTGQLNRARERATETAAYVVWDVGALLSGDDMQAASEVERGCEIIIHAGVNKSSAAAEKEFEEMGTMQICSVYDSVEERQTARDLWTNVEPESPPGNGLRNKAGSYRDVERNHSLVPTIYAKHIPVHSTTKGTMYDINALDLPALSTEYSLHHGLNRVFGTTGAGYIARDVRNKMRQLLQKEDIVSAVQLQMLADYGCWGALETYGSGLEELIRYMSELPRIDGRPFLWPDQMGVLLEWLREQIRLSTESFGEYIHQVWQQIVDLLNRSL